MNLQTEYAKGGYIVASFCYSEIGLETSESVTLPNS